MSVQAQSPYVGESVYYSRLQFAGPARTQGIAGANVALGADFGNLTSNPAGLGLFRKSEMHISPGIGLGSSDASGTGAAQTQDKNSFHIASVGVVFAGHKPDDDQSSNWRGGSFALGFSRLADFNTAFRYSGQVADNQSIFQRLREPGGYTSATSGSYNDALDKIDKQFNSGEYYNLDGLAYGAYLTDFTQGGNSLDILGQVKRSSSLTVPQTETVTRSGSVSQFDLGYGGSYRDRLYIGAALGIVSSNRQVVRDFSETRNNSDATTSFSSLLLHDEVKTAGNGINFRMGLIYRASDIVRVGASVQTPTYFKFSESINTTSLTTVFSPAISYVDKNNQTQTVSGATVSAPLPPYAYTLTTPFRANGGIAITLGKRGFVTGDIEYVGYQQARLHNDSSDANGDNYSFADENQSISTLYQNAINLRFGAEARFDIFRLRAGYARYGDPYKVSTIDRAQNFYTLGAGLRQNNFFLDVAAVYTTFNQQYSPYALVSGMQPVINVDASRYTTTVTAGVNF